MVTNIRVRPLSAVVGDPLLGGICVGANLLHRKLRKKKLLNELVTKLFNGIVTGLVLTL